MALALRLELPVADADTQPASAQNIVVNDMHSSFSNQLHHHVMQAWHHARNTRSQVTQEIITARHERKFKYDPTRAAQLASEGTSNIFVGLADYKCRLLKAFLKDLLIGQGEKPWGVTPTPEPELPVDFRPLINQAVNDARQLFVDATGEEPPKAKMHEYRSLLEEELVEELKSDAKKASMRMEEAIEDAFVEGDFYQSLIECLDDLVTCPSMVLKGPLIKQQPKISWQQNQDGNWSFTVEQTLKTYWQRVDPMLIYPAENSQGVNHRYLCEVGRSSRRVLEEMRSTPGVNNAAIDMLLQHHAVHGLDNWLGFAHHTDTEVQLEYQHPDASFDMLIYWGDVSGATLMEWARNSNQVLDVEEHKLYSCCVNVIGDFIIKIRLNYHPLNHKPYYVTSFEEEPQSFWGRSVCEIIRPIADMANANARAIANNMGLASGPQVEVNMELCIRGSGG